MTPICALDTETTGLHAGREAWDIAIIRRDDHGEDEWQFYVDVDLSTAEPTALKIGGFYERHPWGRYLAGDYGRPFHRRAVSASRQVGRLVDSAEAAALVARLTHGAHIVGAVPSFDTEVLAELLRRHGLSPGWHHRIRCVETLACGYLKREVGGLEEAAEAFGIDVREGGRHTALGDAQVALAVWDRVMTDAS